MIHYHGIPFSGGTSTHFALQGKHAFVSFAHSREMELAAELCQSFALDNGAFSAWKSGTPFDLEGYADWISDWYRHPGLDFYVIPDVIDGDENDNTKMRAKWFNSVDREVWAKGYPVWHMHEPIEYLKTLICGFPGICIGSSGQFSEVGTSRWWERMSEAMSALTDDQGRPFKPIHGLRMLDPTIFSHLPLASADSTNVGRNCGIDQRWKGTYAPTSPRTRAMIMMERIENHAAASRWVGSNGANKNYELFG